MATAVRALKPFHEKLLLLSLLLASLLSHASAQSFPLSQLESDLSAFPDYSLFVQALQKVPNWNTQVGDLSDHTVFAFTNEAADNFPGLGGQQTFGFNLSLYQCALNDPTNNVLNGLIYFNIVEGKYTAAQLLALAPQGPPGPTAGRGTQLPNLSGTPTLTLWQENGQLFINGIQVVNADLINDPTVSVHGLATLSLPRPSVPGAPNGYALSCTAQADPCETYQVRVCGYEDSNAICVNPAFGQFTCQCSPGYSGSPCVSGAADQGVCGSGAAAAFPTRCYFNNDPLGRYVCCDQSGCDGFNPPDYSFPHCSANGYVPPGYGIGASPAPTPSVAPPPANAPPTGDQGVCGSGDAAAFPTRCYFNNDPQGRYVCCDNAGCDGFNPPDYSFPHCAETGHVPPGYGISTSGGGGNSGGGAPTTGDQGVCGTAGDAAAFPTRCYFNNDPLGRYVCCDTQGCDGFNPPDNFFPHCANNGYVPPGTT